MAAGAGCRLLGWAGDQSACSWPFQHGHPRGSGFLLEVLPLPKSGAPRGQGRDCMTFREKTSKVTKQQQHFHSTPVAKAIMASSSSTGKEVAPASQWEKTQRIWGGPSL